MSGLAESLAGQGKTKEAEEVKMQFAEAWKYSDTSLKASVIDPEKRKDLALKIDANSPNTLVYLAGAFCSAK